VVLIGTDADRGAALIALDVDVDAVTILNLSFTAEYPLKKFL
jgi:hypothetical protein